jgi:hypothetical protein
MGAGSSGTRADFARASARKGCEAALGAKGYEAPARET